VLGGLGGEGRWPLPLSLRTPYCRQRRGVRHRPRRPRCIHRGLKRQGPIVAGQACAWVVLAPREHTGGGRRTGRIPRRLPACGLCVRSPALPLFSFSLCILHSALRVGVNGARRTSPPANQETTQVWHPRGHRLPFWQFSSRIRASVPPCRSYSSEFCIPHSALCTPHS
jgi:hypothetical protein